MVASPPSSQAEKSAAPSLIRSVGVIGGLTMVSRLFGFLRDMLLARVLGAGGVADAWQLAFQIPNIFRRLFAEGAFAAAFVPLFNRRMASEDAGAAQAKRFADDILACLIPLLIIFSALMLMILPWLLGLFASDALAEDEENFDLAVTMARIAFPYLALMSLATLFASILNSLSRFAAAAAAPIFLNLCLISALLFGSRGSVDIAGTDIASAGAASAQAAMQANTGLLLAIAVTTSGAIQLLWLYIWLRRAGFRLSLRLPRLTKGVREFGRTILPVVFGAGIYQISRFIDLLFLSILPEKSISYLAFADRVNQLPLGIIGIALGTAILPSLSRLIAQRDSAASRRVQSDACELALLFTLPAAAALYLAGPAIASAIYVGGNFSTADGQNTGEIISALVIGLPAYVLIKVLAPNFFARKDTRTPVYVATAALVINVGLNFLLIPSYGLRGLALAGACAAWCNCAMLYGLLHMRGYFYLSLATVGRILRIAVATLLMSGLLWYGLPFGEQYYIGSASERVGAMLLLVGSGAAVFFASAWLLGVFDLQRIAQLGRAESKDSPPSPAAPDSRPDSRDVIR